MKTKFILLVVSCFMTLFFINSVSAWGPSTHYYIVSQSLARQNDTLISQIILDNYDACLVGLVYADVGIFEYYTNFKEYAGLHNYNTVDELLRLSKDDRDRAFAYCWKLHLAADGVSHNYFVPQAIISTKIPNYLLHPPKELGIEGRYLSPVANRMMEGHTEFDELVEQATGRDWSPEAIRLNTLVGGGQFYSEAYTIQSTTTFGKIQRGFFWVVAKVVPKSESEILFVDYAIDENIRVLKGETPSLEPSGEISLRMADQQSAIWTYGITFLVIGVVFFISFKKRWIGFSKGR